MSDRDVGRFGRWASTYDEHWLQARFVRAAAEHLPFDGGEFDLVTSTVSFHHWRDQREGLREIRRVLAPEGSLVLADMFAVSWLRVWFAVIGRRERFDTLAEIERMLRSAGLTPGGFEPIITTFGRPVVSSVWARGWRLATSRTQRGLFRC